MSHETMSEEDRELHALLARTPRGFRRRLELVLRAALEDEDNGSLRLSAEASGRGPNRMLRGWEGAWTAKGQPEHGRKSLTGA